MLSEEENVIYNTISFRQIFKTPTTRYIFKDTYIFK